MENTFRLFSHCILYIFFLSTFFSLICSISINVCWDKRELHGRKNTHYPNEFDVNPATCSFLRALRYIEDQIKSSHRISIRLLNTIQNWFSIPRCYFAPLSAFLSSRSTICRSFSMQHLYIDKNNLIGNKCYTNFLCSFFEFAFQFSVCFA